MLHVILSVVQITTAAVAAWVTARCLFGRTWDFPHSALRTAVLTAVGLLIWSHVIFGLAVLQAATPRVFFGLFLLFCAATLGAAITAMLHRRATGKHSLSSAQYLLPFVVVTLYALWLLASASLPPTATDELAYHLDVPRQFLTSSGLPFFRENIYAYYPQFGEMWFLFGLAVGGETAARSFHVLFVLLTALAIYGYTREHLDQVYARLAAALFLTIPTVMVVGAWAYVDVMFTCFAFLALVALLRFLETQETKWLVLTALMAGGACSTKYTGIQLTLLLLLVVLVEQFRGRIPNWRTAPVWLGLIALLIPLPYYVRNLVATGWPLFPFQLPFFALAPEINWDETRATLLLKFLSGYGSGTGDSVWVTFLGPILVFLKAQFHDLNAYDGFLGPVFLLTPLLWLRVKNPGRPMKTLALFTLLFFGYWSLTTQQVRFLLPILPALILLLVYALGKIKSEALAGVVWLFVGANLALGVLEATKLGPLAYWTGRESRSAFLTRTIPVYEAYQQANLQVGPSGRVYLACAHNLLYYLDCPFEADYLFEDHRFAKALEESTEPRHFLTFFESLGVTHLLLNEFILTHPAAGLPPRELEKLRKFLSTYAQQLYQKGAYRLFRLERGEPLMTRLHQPGD
jgi:4-amino-4-deoxy-L-arabinose transferase-like glycosyltransferase